VGVVATFDPAAGFGTLRDDTGAEHFFHCTQVAGGSRTITQGVRVAYELRPGHGGRWEAARVTPL
jgi:cold shock CspA family protein